MAARKARLPSWPSSCGLKALTKTLASTVNRGAGNASVPASEARRRRSGILSPRTGEDLHAAPARPEPALEPPACAQECCPRFVAVGVVRSRRGLVRIDRQDDRSGVAAVRHDVGRPRFPNLPDDPRRVRLELPDTDLRRRVIRRIHVVTHATTLHLFEGGVKGRDGERRQTVGRGGSGIRAPKIVRVAICPKIVGLVAASFTTSLRRLARYFGRMKNRRFARLMASMTTCSSRPLPRSR